MGIWKNIVAPKFKNLFEKSSVKKAAAAEIVKTFDEAKEANTKEFEDKKAELEPKVLEIYQAAPSAVKALIKDPTDSSLKKNSAEVQKVLDKLAGIEFPGAKPVAEATKKVGVVYLSGPVSYIFGLISPSLPVEEKPAEPAPEAPAAAATTTEEASTATVTDKEIVPEAATEEKKDETPAVAEPVKAAEPEKTPEPVKAAEPVAAPVAAAPAAPVAEPVAAPAPAAAEPPKP